MVTAKTKLTLPKDAAAGKRFGIVAAHYHEELTQVLHAGAVSVLKEHGAKADNIVTVWVPGSFEIPLAARAMAQQSFDAIICLGVIVKGETSHDKYIAREVARGISQISQKSGIPVSFGVLTTQTLEQAQARAGGDKGNKGAEAAETAVAMIHVLKQIKDCSAKPSQSVGFGFGPQ
ncbi:MAG: 6,7-dimethyl-8-ribityllumazine synthase [Elusimicrobiota bacterium]|jgi:6,7-dimethyl-8-ribityllumazine synthase